MKTIINRKKYTVWRHINDMEYNYYFTDKNDVDHLVDGFNVQEFEEDNGLLSTGIEAAIQYARVIASASGGAFWWKVLEAKK